MTLPTGGPLLASMINVELGRNANDFFHLNGANERRLAGVPTGQVDFSDFYGKSRGEPTPDADFPDPNTVTKSGAWVSASESLESSVTFGVDGSITVVGTPTTALPGAWYVNGVPPPEYKIIFVMVSSTFTGDTDVRGTIPSTGIWFPITSDWAVYARLYKATVPTESTTMSVVFDVSISGGSAVVISFRLTLSTTMTP